MKSLLRCLVYQLLNALEWLTVKLKLEGKPQPLNGLPHDLTDLPPEPGMMTLEPGEPLTILSRIELGRGWVLKRPVIMHSDGVARPVGVAWVLVTPNGKKGWVAGPVQGQKRSLFCPDQN
jgi:hypothetical protein